MTYLLHSSHIENKTRTSKVGAIYNAQKAQIVLKDDRDVFMKTPDSFFSVPKNVKGGPFGVY